MRYHSVNLPLGREACSSKLRGPCGNAERVSLAGHLRQRPRTGLAGLSAGPGMRGSFRPLHWPKVEQTHGLSTGQSSWPVHWPCIAWPLPARPLAHGRRQLGPSTGRRYINSGRSTGPRNDTHLRPVHWPTEGPRYHHYLKRLRMHNIPLHCPGA